MLSIYFIVISLIINSQALSIGTVSAQNVTKREASVGDLFPDWVPFKNKHGEELGEFVQVAKPKPKKRLAPPINFILRAVAEPEGDDYYDKGQGESDSEDYYEKREWSDLNRVGPGGKIDAKDLNHTEISDIDGVVDIITQRPNPIVEAIKRAKVSQEAVKEEEEKKNDDTIDKDKIGPTIQTKIQRAKPEKYEYDLDYEEVNADKRKTVGLEDDQNDSAEKKASILDSVDELKERHAEEQRTISEKIKEEEMYKEERERDNIEARLSNGEPDKYQSRSRSSLSKKAPAPDYEEYDETSSDDKYVIIPERATRTTTTVQSTQRTPKPKTKNNNKRVETGKVSVFKNPQLYMIYDYDSEETSTSTTTTTTPKPRPTLKNYKKKEKYSSKYTSTPVNPDDNERISLLPDASDGREGEPTLFFPKKRKNKKRKNKPTTSAIVDSSVAETVSNKRAKLTSTTAVDTTTAAETTAAETNAATDTTSAGLTRTGADTTTAADITAGETTAVTDTSAADSITSDSTAETGPSADANVETTSDQITTNTDAVAAATEAEKKDENYHREKGGGKEYSSSHEEEHDEEGKKAYEGVHKETKTAKGHHEKENHLGKYDDKAGIDKHHEEESGHYGAHHHEEHGKKHAKYEESGKHSKGHSTKGSHDIHKKEEYEKKVEFFEEEGDSGEEEKHGGYNDEHSHGKGGHYKKDNLQASHAEHTKGDSGHFAKGGHLHVSRGHKEAGGHDGHAKNGHTLSQKANRASGKNWIFHHGYPAKTSNLVRIDRRADQFYHGPQYYG